MSVRATAAANSACLSASGRARRAAKDVAVVPDRQPVEGQAGAVRQHRLARTPAGEVLVVHAHRGPVGGLPDDDIQRVGAVAVGKDGAAELEQQEIERGLEILRQMRLHERGPDRPQIVGQADADARFLARFGLAVGRQRHRCRNLRGD